MQDMERCCLCLGYPFCIRIFCGSVLSSFLLQCCAPDLNVGPHRCVFGRGIVPNCKCLDCIIRKNAPDALAACCYNHLSRNVL